MFAGSYRAAAAAARTMTNDVDAFYRPGVEIHAKVVEALVEIVQMETQERRAMNYEERATLEQEELSEDAIVGLLRSTDALDPRLWVLLGRVGTTTGDAFIRFLVAARFVENSPRSWVVALCLGLESDASADLLGAVCDDGIWFAGGGLALLTSLAELETQVDDEVFRRASELIAERASTPRPRYPKVARALAPDEPDYIEVAIPTVHYR